MEGLRFYAGSKRYMGRDEVADVTLQIMDDIDNDQYDGYKTPSARLAKHLSFWLCSRHYRRVRTDVDKMDNVFIYRVWVERQ